MKLLVTVLLALCLCTSAVDVDMREAALRRLGKANVQGLLSMAESVAESEHPLNVILTTVKAMLVKAEIDIGNLKHEWGSYDRKYKTLSANLTDKSAGLKSRVSSTENQVADKETKLTAAEKRLELVSKALDDLKAQLKDVKEQLTSGNKTRTAEREEFRRKFAEAHALELALTKLIQRLSSQGAGGGAPSQQKMAELLEAAASVMNTAQQQVSAPGSDSAVLEALITLRQELFQFLNTTVERERKADMEYKKLRTALLKTRDLKTTEITDKSDAKAKAEEERANAQTDLDLLRSALSSLKDQLRTLTEQISNIRNEYNQRQGQYQKELSALNDSVETLRHVKKVVEELVQSKS